MKITILDKSKVKYNGHYLVEFQTYDDIDEQTANELTTAKIAKRVDDSVSSVSYTTGPESNVTPKFDVKKNGGYVAEAVLTPEQKRALEEQGVAKNDKGQVIAKDETPVTGNDSTNPKDTTPEPRVVAQKVYDENGKELTEEEIKAKEAAVAAKSPADKLPTPKEAAKSGQEVA